MFKSRPSGLAELPCHSKCACTQAEELLKKVGDQVQPIMKKRQLRVPLLSEFFPRHANLVHAI